VVIESDNLDEPEVQDLISAGIDVLGDRREGLMHNKFVIIDALEVWTGSMNFTTNGAYLNDNNLVRIRSSRLAQDYTVEFEEMFEDDLFGPDDRPNTPYPRLTIEGTDVEVYFSPDDHTIDRLLELVQAAQSSIYFLAYSYTSDPLAAAMIARAGAGVTVQGVFEESQYESNIGTEFDVLQQAGLPVYLDGNPHNMHHKVILIDDQIVITGSYNFSANAEDRNDENTLIINNADIAALYRQEFERVLQQANP
jgi:phosphatidylserine/phosphatidylglycerophosphate/cardiolipin synthase-like enzyme